MIKIYPPSRSELRSIDTKFALQQDNWNDYSFQTLYGLYYQSEEAGAPLMFIGGVKILKRGQTSSDPLQVTEDFETLGPEFCSVGNGLDYYERLAGIRRDDRREILSALRDVVAQPELSIQFSHEQGWKTSLFRDNSAWDNFLDDALAVHNKDFSRLADITAPFSFKPSLGSETLKLAFSTPEPELYSGPYRRLGPSRKEVLLPRRVFALIGRNGSGKSTLLSRIAHVAFASRDDREVPEMRRMGTLAPDGINFLRVITVSYSAFDSFSVPGTLARDKRQVATDIEKGEGRFIYCGLRDIAAEIRDDLDRRSPVYDENSIARQRRNIRLKDIEVLGDEFARLVQKINDTGKRALFNAALEPLLADPSFAQASDVEPEDFLAGDPKATFLSWSTGHKIALHVIASLAANATRKSLVLFDEPEMHLHPPLTAALMHSLRIILEEANAFCIVATHSPVVIQETLARHVRVVTRSGEDMQFNKPRLETFGENVGVLTYDTFGLTSSSTDFHEILNMLVRSGETIETIDGLFSPALSGQARAYVMSKMAKRASE